MSEIIISCWESLCGKIWWKFRLLLPSDVVIDRINRGLAPVFDQPTAAPQPPTAPTPPEAPGGEDDDGDGDDELEFEDAPGRDEEAPEMPVPFMFVGGEFEPDGDYEMVVDSYEDDHAIPLEAYDSAADQEEAARKRHEQEKAVKKAKKKLNNEYREAMLSISQAIDIYNSTNVSRHFCTFAIPGLFHLNYLIFLLLFHWTFFPRYILVSKFTRFPNYFFSSEVIILEIIV